MIAILITSVAPATASEGCSNEARREEQGAAGRALPDCRAYELVSLPNQPYPFYIHYSYEGVAPTFTVPFQNFGELPTAFPVTQPEEGIALDGNAVLFGSTEPSSEADGDSNNLSRRGPDGWVGENIQPTQSRHGFLCLVANYVGYSQNLEKVVFSDGYNEQPQGDERPYEDCGHDEPRLVPGESENTGNLFLRDTATRSWQLVNATQPLPGTKPHAPWFAAISPDGSHVVFQSRMRLTTDAPLAEANNSNLNEQYCRNEFGDYYVSSGGTVHLLTILPGGTPVLGTLAGAHPYPYGCGSVPWQTSEITHSVSADGNRILFYAGGAFTTRELEVAPNAPYIHGGLYLRQRSGAAQSALAHGGALGAGTLTAGSKEVTSLLQATGAANLYAGSDKLRYVGTEVGEFRAGQPIAGEGIPPGTTIAEVGFDAAALSVELILSAPVEAGKSGHQVPIRATAPQPPFAVGQTIVGEGISPGTTIAAVGSGTLTLSAAATANEAEVALEASSECTEPAKACTVRIDLPEGGSGSPGGGNFQWANAETTKIFFTDVEKLTPDSTAEAGKPDLYEYDLEKPQGQRLTDLTANAGEPADVLGVSGASEDGSYLYFAAKGVLSGTQQNSHGAAALAPAAGTGTLTEGSDEVTGVSTTSGAFHVGMAISGEGIPPNNTWITEVGTGTLTLSNGATESGTKTLAAAAANLYLRHAGATTFIATLNAAGGDQCDWTAFCITSRVSRNGTFIAFDSIDSLTGYDNHPVHPEACRIITQMAGQPCPEAFRYAAASGAHGELTCAACNPSGAPPASEFAWAVIPQPYTGEPGQERPPSHALSDSGQVVFETIEKLVPGDENETWDVYEYSGGEGPSAQLHLISSGKSELPSYVVGVTPDGSNVFFVTAQSLLRADTKTDYDLYDARVGGGFAEPLIPQCEGEGCHPAYPGVPGSSSPGSASFEGKGNVHPAGTGNVPPAKCKKGFVKKKGKCVKQRKKKSKKAKKKKSKKAKKSIRRAAK
jgi:hypothetical protein